VKERCGIDEEDQPLKAEGGPIRIALRGGGALRLASCDGNGITPDRFVGGFIGLGGGTMVALLPPQRYFVQHTGTPVVSKARVTVESLGPLLGTGPCDERAPTISVDATPREFQVAVPADGQTWWARLELARTAQVSRVPPAAELWLCPACGPGPDAGCRPIAAEPEQTRVPAGSQVMWLRAPPDPRRFAIAAFLSDP
jgi:hypothetical protein